MNRKRIINLIKEKYNIFKKIVYTNRRSIAKAFLGVLAVMSLGILIECFVFGYELNAKDANNNISVVDRSKIETEGFVSDSKGDLVAQQENASLTIFNDGNFVNDLEIEISNNADDSLTINYIDKEGKEITQKNELQKNIKKSGYDFMPFLTFHIDNNPEKIKIEFKSRGISVSQIKIDNSYHFNQYRFFFLFSIGLLVFLFIFFRNTITLKPEYGFLIASLVLGGLLVFVQMRTFISWDERIHYKNADGLSLKNIAKKRVDDVYAKTNSVPYSYSIREQEAVDDFLDNQFKEKRSKSNNELNFSLKETYNKLAYLPAATGLFLGRLIHLPYYMIFMLGRLATLVCYSLVVFFALSRLKNGKMLMSVVALLPTSLFIASSYSYDFWVTSFTMLGSAYLFRELETRDKLSKKNLLIMLGAFVVGLGPKAIYFPLMLLVFFIGKDKFKNRNDYNKFLLLNIVAILIVAGSFLLPFFVSGEGGGDTRGGKGINSAEQVKFIITEPLRYARILFNFLGEYISPANAMGYTTSFAYLGFFMGPEILLSLMLFVAIFDRNEGDKTYGWKIKISMLGIFIVVSSLISTALYVAFTPVRHQTINGVQPRYLTPLIFPLMYVMFSSRIKNPFNRKFFIFAIFASISVVALIEIWELVVRNYF